MAEVNGNDQRLTPAEIVLPADGRPAAGEQPLPVWLLAQTATDWPELTDSQAAWLKALDFVPKARKLALLPATDGSLAGAVFGMGEGDTGDPCGPGVLLAGLLPGLLPANQYAFAGIDPPAQELAAIAWGLGAYKYRRYKTSDGDKLPQLVCAAQADRDRVVAVLEAVWMARDLINTPASDMGPEELEQAARGLADKYGAAFSSIVDDDLLSNGLPMIHAVGRASDRRPRLIDFRWGPSDAPKVTLVGKGICFDTGGLDIKPASGMLLMKKDMGGAASVLAVASMVMALNLNVRLRVLIPAAENSISSNAFRPQDVIKTRAGITVEIGNTDAEGRLVLCDALALADEEVPDKLITFSTLTGAARVALGADLPAFYTDDDAFAGEVSSKGLAIGDPVWRMPFWPGYDRNLDNETADISNIGEGGFAGSIVAALYLKKFVKHARSFSHLDMYGWRQSQRPLGPKGGEATAARAIAAALEAEYGRIV